MHTVLDINYYMDYLYEWVVYNMKYKSNAGINNRVYDNLPKEETMQEI